ncbi:hypothetical protein DYB37_010332 [Aphanomyces astaci]|uniref:Cyclin-dependent kinase 2 homolog n=1 Tax=Aphanomyces astaci TaxID=112090 RepID=A0A3R7AJE8_APHAT|nr:hypothetical protein DYB35_007767 [Aphanomyces astaci]RHZ27248.1 hypothetical protein DYB37_010332 [Aphanomyces astaci]
MRSSSDSMESPRRGFDDKYELLERLGHGNFGEVYRIREIATGQVLALKRIRTGTDASKMDTIPAAAFNEIQAMYHLDHPNDIKPSNLLMDRHGVLKLSDFGLATVYTGPAREYAHQVATRWYRAPELLFGSRSYDHKVDMWAVGVVFAELLQHAPLFPGLNDIDQIFRVMQVLGSPTWPGMAELPDYHKVSFPAFNPLPLASLFPDVEETALDLLKCLLVYDPSKRLEAAEVGLLVSPTVQLTRTDRP